MTFTKLETCAILSVVFLFATVSAGGSKGYDDDCIIGIIAGVGLGNEADTCNDDKNLVCLSSKCKCNPALYVHENGWLGLEFLGGGCKTRATFPCSESGTSCVSNSVCNTVCMCNEGYHVNGLKGDCTNGAIKIGSSLGLFFGLILCYFRFY